MWRCVNCGEKNEAPFKSCWQCESLRDGRQKAQFDASDSSSLVASVSSQPLETDTDLMTKIASRFVCSKCRYRGAEVRASAGFEGLISASCSHCSYTELYHSDILKRQGDPEAALTLLFGPPVR